MSDIRFRVDVSGKSVVRDIRDALRDGMESGGEDVARGIEKVASRKIRDEGAVWRHELLEGFTKSVVQFGGDTHVRVGNVSDHAKYQERGVSGQVIKRNTPHAYEDEGPPIEALIPWVRDHLWGTGFDPFDGDDGADGGAEPEEVSTDTDGDLAFSPVKDSDLGNIEVGDLLDNQYATRLPVRTITDEGAFRVGWGKDQYWLRPISATNIEVHRVNDDGSTEFIDAVDSMKWHSEVSDSPLLGIDWNYLDSGGEEINPFREHDLPDGFSSQYDEGFYAKIGSWSVGDEAYFHNTDGQVYRARISDDNGDGSLKIVRLDGSDFADDWRPADEAVEGVFLVAVEKTGYDDSIAPEDFVPPAGYTKHSVNEWDFEATYPGQQVIIFDRDYGTYRDGVIKEFPSEQMDRVVVEEDDGFITTIATDNPFSHKLLATRDWSDLTENAQKSVLRQDWEDNIVGNRTDHFDALNRQGPNGDIVEDLDATTASKLTDWLFEDVWNIYDSDRMKEMMKRMISSIQYKDFMRSKSPDNPYDNGVLGGVSGIGNGATIGIWLGDSGFQKTNRAKNGGTYLSTVIHESEHAMTRARGFNKKAGGNGVSRELDDVNFLRSGLQTNPHADSTHAEDYVFYKEAWAGGSEDLIGWDNWREDVYASGRYASPGATVASYTSENPEDVFKADGTTTLIEGDHIKLEDPIGLEDPLLGTIQEFNGDIAVDLGDDGYGVGVLTTEGDSYVFRWENDGTIAGIEQYANMEYVGSAPNADAQFETPDFVTVPDEDPEAFLREAASAAWWFQVIRAQTRHQRGDPVRSDDGYFISRKYSAHNADETLAMTNQVLGHSGMDGYESYIDGLVEFYPWLLKAWVMNRVPGQNQRAYLASEYGFPQSADAYPLTESEVPEL